VRTPRAQQTSPTNGGAGRVRLDPTASPELSGEYPYEPSASVPFGMAFARSRRLAFLAGCGAGASGAMVLVGAVTLVAWLSGPRSETPVTTPPPVNLASKTEQASAPLAAVNATLGRDRAAPDVPRRARQAPRVVAPPVLVETVAEARPPAVEREVAARAGGDEGKDSPAPADEAEPKQLAEADHGEASDSVAAQAQTPEGHGPALDEHPAAPTEAPAQGDEPADEANRVALVHAVEPEQAAAPDGAPGAPANEDRGQ
jgi:hypothetical protein